MNNSKLPEKRLLQILVVDDCPDSQIIFQMILESLGHHPEIVGSGDAALKCLIGTNYDLVFTDLHMSGTNGFQLSEHIRQHCPQTKVVAITGDISEDLDLRCRQSGIAEILQKPLQREAIKKILAKNMTTPSDFPIPGESIKKNVPLNYAEVLEEFLQKKELVDSTIKNFIQRNEKQIPQLQGAIEKNDSEFIASEFHRIKGGALNLRANHLAEIAQQLEKAGRDKRFEQMPLLWKNYLAAFGELKAYCAELGLVA